MLRAWRIFAICALHFFLSQLYRTTNAVLSPWLITDLALDTESLGLLSAVFFYAFALTQIPLTLWLDRVGAKRMMVACAVLGLAGALLFSLSRGLAEGVAGRLLLGVGMACNLMGPLKLLAAWFSPAVFATVSGLLYAAGTLGNVAAATPLVLLVEHVGWRAALQAVALLHLLALLALVLGVPADRPEGKAAGSGGMRLLTRLIRSRDYWILSGSTFVRYGTHAALQTLWAGPFLMEALGFRPREAGHILLALNAGVIAGAPLWGVVADRVFRTPKWVVCCGLLGLAAAGAALRALGPGGGVAAAGALFFAYGLFSSSGWQVYSHAKALFPREMAGAAMSGVNFFTMLGPAVFLQGIGLFLQGAFPEDPRGVAAFRGALLLCVFCQAAIGGLYAATRTR
ncbi:MAG: MFS transporter [Desulfobacterales bacterium]